MSQLFLVIAAGVALGFVLALVYWGILSLLRPVLDHLRKRPEPARPTPSPLGALPQYVIQDALGDYGLAVKLVTATALASVSFSLAAQAPMNGAGGPLGHQAEAVHSNTISQ